MRTTDQASAPSPSVLSGAHYLASPQVDAWIAGLHSAGEPDGPTAQELQSSFSWRVTRPIRAVRARERVALLKQRRLRFPPQPRTRSDGDRARVALEQRVRAVAPALLPSVGTAELAALPLERLLSELVQQVQSSGAKAELWLLVIAVSGCFPDQQMLFGLARDMVGVTGASAAQRILNHSAVWTIRYHAQLRTLRLVTDVPVVFTDQTAKFGFNSGIQRVTRQTVSRWAGREEFQLAALTDDGAGLRTLSLEEQGRVLDWQGDDDRDRDRDDRAEPDESDAELVVPWQTTFFIPEVPVGRGTDALAALTRFSRNRTVAIGYDTIPVSSGHLVHRGLSGLFVSYLSTIKYIDEIVAISNSTASEFVGFSEALATQGLPGFDVTTVHLPIEHIPADDGEPPVEPSLPVVLSVGSNEPRKNQLAVIFASEILWREGLEFSLVLLGGRGDKLYTDIPDAVAALRDQGRQIELRRDVDEHALAAAYRRARFSVFISLQEGYGLPIAESLAVGTPALATSYGSTAEIAAGGGCVTADPRDDRSVADGMRALLTDDALLDRLKAEIESRDDSTWEAYSDSLWSIVSPAGARS
ncbi:hypothetical protein C5B96_09135 [Subtercola sp. Z020]|uniref:glycosyltransferase n=1 Tax=Subtercola sp. Z020 TaxID=2080582 RepID=UPI000CE8D856|nr:glycosyltransferase [Subtercola sp. Z020]PPF82452.1 hypothetical protein C5B96_09135 [Subtercola sp. Z020]